eukprot:5672344-Pleurochrysis_carterae.AAC.1
MHTTCVSVTLSRAVWLHRAAETDGGLVGALRGVSRRQPGARKKIVKCPSLCPAFTGPGDSTSVPTRLAKCSCAQVSKMWCV